MIPLTGYASRLSARPGDTIDFKISSTADVPYEAQLIRIVSADPNPDGPGIVHRDVSASLNGRYPSRRQDFQRGSFARIDAVALQALSGFTAAALIWPTLPEAGPQAILSWLDASAGFELAIGPDGLAATLRTADGGTYRLTTGSPLRARRWARIWASFDPVAGKVLVGQRELERFGKGVRREERLEAGRVRLGGLAATILIAASNASRPGAFFNGKIEAPALFDRAIDPAAIDSAAETAGCVAAWDFSLGIDSDRIADRGPLAMHGRLVNLPTRAVTGAQWSGREQCWRHAPQDYAAIAFHEDDVYDCGWETDFSFTVPAELPSGVYAVRLRCDGHEDTIPFFVCAPLGRKGADLCVVVPTFTYVVYANNARYDFGPALKERMVAWGAYPWNPAEHPDYGLCTYNLHPDGSGLCFASMRRPLLTLRSGYLTLLIPGCGSGLRHFQADSHLFAWLDSQGLAFDVVTDQELHDDGAAALAPYRTVLTCTHPEYHTARSLDALQSYLDGGGRLAYLGGNGFYWKIGVSETIPDVLEIRRAEGGLRTWAAEPGESYHALDGEYGGLWRRNGRPPQRLAGVGFSAQGTFLGSYYRRTAASYEPRFAWLFDGIPEEVIGDFGLSGGGAAGYELDRVDHRLGSPDNLVVLARSEAHAPTYMATPEEILSHVSTVTGDPPAMLIRADMSYFETAAGGAVFSAGSITFCGSLPWRKGENNVSRLLNNLLQRFLG
jgi:N,N-dimethylformamidase